MATSCIGETGHDGHVCHGAGLSTSTWNGTTFTNRHLAHTDHAASSSLSLPTARYGMSADVTAVTMTVDLGLGTGGTICNKAGIAGTFSSRGTGLQT